MILMSIVSSRVGCVAAREAAAIFGIQMGFEGKRTDVAMEK
jgi:hypothetical protein